MLRFYLLFKLFTLFDLTRVSVDQVALRDVSLGDHGVFDHVQNCVLQKPEQRLSVSKFIYQIMLTGRLTLALRIAFIRQEKDDWTDQGHEFPLLHDGLQLFAPLWAGCHLQTQQVTGRQVSVAILCHDLLTLSAFSWAGATWHKNTGQILI